ncbi:MAG TPA: aminoacetone oxidase family FAD-binding enzyme [Candidatus Aminicenantes bacterium]|nr:aminoacetone oxidase family FAD-binding enzyme [Candidatus Aminicenantes bacterium]HRY65389.1 aminoacetone oxidase family FAD-binding enzyme [Candidatus Aminicenantes bacterium]HRZ72143.1 aminoacetone oxidase family FAD-binding enzyme [Candidatus Aminicenantes bacterium]
MADTYDLAVVGGGAAGLTAAISAARRGNSVAVLERLPSPGRKILATGGGRCNLLNEGLAPSSFTSTDPALVASVLERFGRREIREFFSGLGLRLQADEKGRVYPATNQAASVLKVLELEVRRLGVQVEAGFVVGRVEPRAGGFRLRAADSRAVEGRAVILAGGGKAYPALGSDGSCYGLAASFGHRIVTPVPSAVPLLVKDRMCHLLQGQRLLVRAGSRIGGRAGRTAEGELLFTQYGLSGTAVLDISEDISIALNRDGLRDVAVVVDLLPDMTAADVAGELSRRMKAGWETRSLVSGLLPEKLGPLVPQLAGEAGAAAGKGDPREKARRLAGALKRMEFAVQGTRGWNEAEFTAGGVDAREVKPGTLESRLRGGLYFAGEVLDVQGGRGGFNLAWAWATGLAAGLTE